MLIITKILKILNKSNFFAWNKGGLSCVKYHTKPLGTVFNYIDLQRIALFPPLEIRYRLKLHYWNVKLRIFSQENFLFIFKPQIDALYFTQGLDTLKASILLEFNRYKYVQLSETLWS
jgi:hypothetical protein